MSDEVLERKVIHPGKPFIKAGEEHARAYILQNGSVQSYVMDGEHKVVIAQYGPGRIIGEICLMSDEPMTMNYEALVDTTVATLTRADFQKRIAKIDKIVATIIEHVMNKLNYQYEDDLAAAQQNMMIDDKALAFADAMLGHMDEHKRFKYESAILPHVNALVKEMNALKKEEQDTEAE